MLKLIQLARVCVNDKNVLIGSSQWVFEAIPPITVAISERLRNGQNRSPLLVWRLSQGSKGPPPPPPAARLILARGFETTTTAVIPSPHLFVDCNSVCTVFRNRLFTLLSRPLFSRDALSDRLLSPPIASRTRRDAFPLTSRKYIIAVLRYRSTPTKQCSTNNYTARAWFPASPRQSYRSRAVPTYVIPWEDIWQAVGIWFGDGSADGCKPS